MSLDKRRLVNLASSELIVPAISSFLLFTSSLSTRSLGSKLTDRITRVRDSVNRRPRRFHISTSLRVSRLLFRQPTRCKRHRILALETTSTRSQSQRACATRPRGSWPTETREWGQGRGHRNSDVSRRSHAQVHAGLHPRGRAMSSRFSHARVMTADTERDETLPSCNSATDRRRDTKQRLFLSARNRVSR